MSSEGKLYGPTLIDEMVATMATLQERVTGSGALPSEAAQRAAERLQKMSEDLKSIRKMLFVKTQGGTELVGECLGPVNAMKATLEGLATASPAEATGQVDAALRAVEEKVSLVVEKARSLVIRMT